MQIESFERILIAVQQERISQARCEDTHRGRVRLNRIELKRSDSAKRTNGILGIERYARLADLGLRSKVDSDIDGPREFELDIGTIITDFCFEPCIGSHDDIHAKSLEIARQA